MSPDTPPAATSQAAEEDQALRDVLDMLLDVGTHVAMDLKRQALARAEPPPEAAPPHPTTDLAEPFERVARALRRTILLIRHIAQTGTQSSRRPDQQRAESRKRIIREVEDAIDRQTSGPAEAEPLQAEFRDRLDAPDLEDEIANRPIAEIIADIARDLGVGSPAGAPNFKWKRRTPRELETLTTRAAARHPNDPYTPGPHGPDPGAPPSASRSRPPGSGKITPDMIQLARTLAGMDGPKQQAPARR